MDWFGLIFLAAVSIIALSMIGGGILFILSTRKTDNAGVFAKKQATLLTWVIGEKRVRNLNRALIWPAGLALIVTGTVALAAVFYFAFFASASP